MILGFDLKAWKPMKCQWRGEIPSSALFPGLQQSGMVSRARVWKGFEIETLSRAQDELLAALAGSSISLGACVLLHKEAFHPGYETR